MKRIFAWTLFGLVAFLVLGLGQTAKSTSKWNSNEFQLPGNSIQCAYFPKSAKADEQLRCWVYSKHLVVTLYEKTKPLAPEKSSLSFDKGKPTLKHGDEWGTDNKEFNCASGPVGMVCWSGNYGFVATNSVIQRW